MTTPVRACLLLFAVLASPAAGADGWPDVVAKAKTATYDVLIGGRHFGTGFVVTKEGLAVTAAHAVAGARGPIQFMDLAGNRVDAEILGRDLAHDLALLQLAEREDPYPHLSVAEKEPAVAAEVAVFGTPIMRRQLLLFGRVASEHAGFEYLGNRAHYVECRYVSGFAPKGTSGGPWLDATGHVVGMQIGGMTLSTGWQGVSFVSPAAAVRRLVEAKADIPTPTIKLVVEETWQQSEEELKSLPAGTNGLFADVRDENGPAAKAGLADDHVIVAVDGQPVRFIADLLRHVRSKSVGTELAVEILTDDRTATRTIKVPVAGLVEATPKPAEKP